MCCNAIVMGYVQDNLSYTREPHTPQMDTFFGGKEDLTGAVGHERSDYTFMGFKKKLKATESTDKSFVDEDLHVIWERGPQIPKMNVQPQDTTFEAMHLYAPNYKNGHDDALYLLKERQQRGARQLNFFKALPYKEIMNNTSGVIRSDTLLGWEFTIGIVLGSLSFLILVTIVLLCCKVDLAKTTKRMEKERKNRALRMHGEVNVVAIQELGEMTNTPIETTQPQVETTLVTGNVMVIESDNVPEVGNGTASEGSSDVQSGSVRSTHSNVDVISVESEVHAPPKCSVTEGSVDEIPVIVVRANSDEVHQSDHVVDKPRNDHEVAADESIETSEGDEINEAEEATDRPSSGDVSASESESDSSDSEEQPKMLVVDEEDSSHQNDKLEDEDEVVTHF